jgi:hypothetical protein
LAGARAHPRSQGGSGSRPDLDRDPTLDPRNISFAGTSYRVGRANRRRQVQLAIVGDVVEISSGGEVIRTHPIRHDRSREHGAFANPGGRPHRINAA